MSGLFDRIQKNIEDTEKDSGVSMADVLTMPGNLRRVMVLLLRSSEPMTYEKIFESLAVHKDKDQLTEAALQEALTELVKDRWLFEMGQDKVKRYKVNLRRKQGSQLGAGVWGSLDQKIANFATEKGKPAGDAPESEAGAESDSTTQPPEA